MQRQGGSLTFDIDVKSEESPAQQEWSNPKKTTRAIGRDKMDVDTVASNRYSALWGEELDADERNPFHRR